jgi:hypothetical protein
MQRGVYPVRTRTCVPPAGLDRESTRSTNDKIVTRYFLATFFYCSCTDRRRGHCDDIWDKSDTHLAGTLLR